MIKDAQYWIKRLNLSAHPEGGYYREIYRSSELIAGQHLPGRYNQQSHTYSTSIYFLLESDDFSAFHRIKSDEIWHFYYGSPVTIFSIDSDGMLFETKLGSNLENGEIFQTHIQAGKWFAARLNDSESYCLVGCTVSPGFEFADFELGKRNQLLVEFPRHKELIRELTRE